MNFVGRLVSERVLLEKNDSGDVSGGPVSLITVRL